MEPVQLNESNRQRKSQEIAEKTKSEFRNLFSRHGRKDYLGVGIQTEKDTKIQEKRILILVKLESACETELEKLLKKGHDKNLIKPNKTCSWDRRQKEFFETDQLRLHCLL